MIRTIFIGLLCVCAAAAQPTLLITLETPALASRVVLSKTGTIGVAVCGDQKLRVWDLGDGRVTAEIVLGDRMIRRTAISADGAWIAAADFAGLYTVWEAATGAQQLQFQLSSYPFALAFSPDGNRLAVAPTEAPVAIYDVKSGRRVLELQQVIGGSQSLAFSRDGRFRYGVADL